MDLQKLFDAMGESDRLTRSRTHLTLGRLIAALESLPSDVVVGLSRPHSYRGYYSDLAFQSDNTTTAEELLEVCRECVGVVFEGYKGGDFTMSEDTPLWIAHYGSCGERLMGINNDGTLVTLPD